MKRYFYSFCLSLALFLAGSATAQTYTMDWGSSFSPVLSAPTTGATALSVGGSIVNFTFSIAISGSGSLQSPYPRVNNNNSNGADFQVQGSTDAIEIDQDLGNKTSSSVTTFTFSSSVTNLTFSIADIDFPGGGTPYDYQDQVTVTGVGPSGALVPTLTEWNPAASIVNITGNTATANSGSGGGNVSSLAQGSPAQNGTVIVDFGSNIVTSVVITYGNVNSANVRNNPRLQAIAIGNISFQRAISLPLSFTAFSGTYQQNQVQLQWQTAAAPNTGTVAVERSNNGRDWSAVPGIAPFTIDTRATYKAVDASPYSGTSFYRLKETTSAGVVFYSRIIRISSDLSAQIKVTAYPNPFSGGFNMAVNWTTNEAGLIQIYSGNGQLIKQQRVQLQSGYQVIPISGLEGAGKGLMLLKLSNEDGSKSVQQRIAQQ